MIRKIKSALGKYEKAIEFSGTKKEAYIEAVRNGSDAYFNISLMPFMIGFLFLISIIIGLSNIYSPKFNHIVILARFIALTIGIINLPLYVLYRIQKLRVKLIFPLLLSMLSLSLALCCMAFIFGYGIIDDLHVDILIKSVPYKYGVIILFLIFRIYVTRKHPLKITNNSDSIVYLGYFVHLIIFLGTYLLIAVIIFIYKQAYWINGLFTSLFIGEFLGLTFLFMTINYSRRVLAYVLYPETRKINSENNHAKKSTKRSSTNDLEKGTSKWWIEPIRWLFILIATMSLAPLADIDIGAYKEAIRGVIISLIIHIGLFRSIRKTGCGLTTKRFLYISYILSLLIIAFTIFENLGLNNLPSNKIILYVIIGIITFTVYYADILSWGDKKKNNNKQGRKRKNSIPKYK